MSPVLLALAAILAPVLCTLIVQAASVWRTKIVTDGELRLAKTLRGTSTAARVEFHHQVEHVHKADVPSTTLASTASVGTMGAPDGGLAGKRRRGG